MLYYRLEQHYWRGTEAGWLGCYDFPGETWAGDGSVYKWVMGADCVCLQRPGYILMVRVGREEEGVSSLRAELAAIARTLQTVQRVLDRAGSNWNKNFLLSTEVGRQNIRQSASEGVQSDLMGCKGLGEEMHDPASGSRKLEQAGGHYLGS